MKKTLLTTILLSALLPLSSIAGNSAVEETQITAEAFNNTDNILERASAIEDIEYKMMVQRATQTAIWAMPAVTQVDFLKATRRDLGGDYNDVIYVTKPFGSDKGFLTANDVTAYSWSTFTSRNGPIVVEVPPATDKVSYFGTFVNQWEQPIEDVGPAGADKGEGGKYLFLPPNYQGEKSKKQLESEGFLVYETDSYDYGFSFRPRLYNGATDQDAADYAKRVKIYSLAEESSPSKTRHIDATDIAYDSLPYYNETYFQDIDYIVQNNPIREQDKVMVSMLKDLGIEKGKPFKPTDIQKKAMNEGLLLAYASMQKFFVEPGSATIPLWKSNSGELKSQWLVWDFAQGQAKVGFPYTTDSEVLLDDRAGGSYFWITYLPKYLGGGTFYLTGLRDSAGEMLNGDKTYKLNVPSDTPAKDFWSAIAYSMETKNFIKDTERVGFSSRNAEEMKVNEDGSYDIYFSPEAPKGMESNWVPTGEDFFLLFRLYGPETKDFYKSWMLGDIEQVN
ncbi:DUF1214 domain-containing protein [Vibrio lamellibrachiae]|uniref:DUF1214 domain-containing protein n=1 Tax=Vibrio lamellibrachiae TaxID=2910253 RepID=UPI003D147F23